MTDITGTTTLTTPSGDIQAAIDAGAALASGQPLEEGRRYAFVVPAGAIVQEVDNDLDAYRGRPRRKVGTVTVLDAAAFIAYLAKHGLPETEVWSNPPAAQLVAVINAHQSPGPDLGGADAVSADGGAGWGDHLAQLRLIPTPAWKAWAKLDRNLVDQVVFAEHVEDHLPDFVEPTGADMLELAQTFSAHRSVRFESSKRVKSGETQLVYKEEEQAAAGRKGQVVIPDAFTIAVKPYEGSDTYKVTARLRYRITESGLRLGYVLDRPEDVLRSAFDDIANVVHAGISHPVWNGIPTG